MNRHLGPWLAGLLLACSTAQADTGTVSASGFTVTHTRPVKATQKQLFEAFGRIGQWWNPQHSYSGQGANLSLDLAAGGCFCERWDGGSVQHMQVVHVAKDTMVRLVGGLGPLQELPVQGVLTMEAATVDGRTVLKLSYRVAGPPDIGLEKWAGPVDKVLGEQVNRLVAYVERP